MSGGEKLLHLINVLSSQMMTCGINLFHLGLTDPAWQLNPFNVNAKIPLVLLLKQDGEARCC